MRSLKLINQFAENWRARAWYIA